MDSQQQITERVNALTPEYREFVTSDIPETLARIFGESFGLDETGIIILENGFMLYLLLFIDKAGLTDFIEHDCNLPQASAVALADSIVNSLPDSMVTELTTLTAANAGTSDVETKSRQTLSELQDRFSATSHIPVAPAPSSNWLSNATLKPAGDETAAITPSASVPRFSPASVSPPPDVPEPLGTPNDTSALEKIRTMNGDVSRIHGYGARAPEENNAADTETIRSVDQDTLLQRPPLGG